MTAATHPADTPERLIAAAIHLFARKGFDGTTVKELAEHAGVNVSLVSYHFNGKEGLYRACLEQFGRERLAVAERVLQPPRSREDFEVRLRMFIEEIVSCHIEQPDLAQIIHREVDMETPIAEDIFRNTFLKVFTTFVGFIEKARAARIVDRALDPQLVGTAIFGSVMHSVRCDRVGKKFFQQSLRDREHRARFIETVLHVALSGCCVREESK